MAGEIKQSHKSYIGIMAQNATPKKDEKNEYCTDHYNCINSMIVSVQQN